jgi:uncharacterized membrane protein YdjX (TVP38/TMEM64 family)/Fe-S oxidoreductase
MNTPQDDTVDFSTGIAQRQVAERCISCGECRETCHFLKTYATPQCLAQATNPAAAAFSFECSLCGLCSAVCPHSAEPAAMFLEMRRTVFAAGAGHFPEHGGLLGYERKGTSRLFTWYGLPHGCTTVFFPGCALPGTRPAQTKAVFNRLQKIIPNLGIVLDCCTKPSHDLGRQEYFLAMFGELTRYLKEHGVTRVLTACPNCYRVFREYAPELATETIYETVLAGELPHLEGNAATVTVHDPCVMRFEQSAQDAVRSLVSCAGLQLAEMPHNRSTAICCGEGGGAGALAPHLAAAWSDLRLAEVAGRPVVTYCAGCANHLGSRTRTSHVLDLLLDRDAALAGKLPVSGAPMTYLNRLLLKRHFRTTLPTFASRERTFSAEAPRRTRYLPLLILVLVLAAVVAARLAGVSHYLEPERLRSFIAEYGVLAPVVYMLVYATAPALFLPGLPITIAGGILFGPVWGVVYTITGATAGACVAFLISRHVARGWVETKLTGSRWRKLDKEVERHGWKVVAFTRLIPLFPFNLLNYAFGLTKIRFVDYAVTTFICMLPACIAFIVFSSSLLDVLRGKVSGTFVLGIVLIVLVSLIPVFYRRWSARGSNAAATDDTDSP